jgi:ribonuclease Z
MKITILGNNSALPAFGRHPTAQFIELSNEYLLMDCGEGTQMRLQALGINASKINHIIISHLHGDHYFGLVGLVSSFSLLGRQKKLHIYGSIELKKILEIQLPWALGFEMVWRFIEESETAVLIDDEKIEVSCFPVQHSVPTHGFIFIEKKRNKILLPEKVKHYEVPKYFYKQLTAGVDYEDRFGNIVKNEWVTDEGLPNKRYVFAADTSYLPSICANFIAADLLYHESTYLKDNQQKAIERFHSTAEEAAQIALRANVKKLIIGHFSSKYKYLEPFLDEAKAIFPETELALEGLTFEI